MAHAIHCVKMMVTFIMLIWASTITLCTDCAKGAQIFQKSGSCLKILGAGRATLSKFHTEDPELLGTTIENSVTWAT